MIKWLLKLLGISSESIDFKALIHEGAVIIDVRSPQEFQSGHVRKSKNIHLNELDMKYKTLKKINLLLLVVLQECEAAQPLVF